MHSFGQFRYWLFRIILCSIIFVVGIVVMLLTELPKHYILIIFVSGYLFAGYDILIKAIRGIIGGNIINENFLMTVATIGAFFVGEYPEAMAVMLFYQIGELFQNYAVNKSRKSISELMDIQADIVTVLRDNEERAVNPETIEKGELIVIKAGERVAIDGIVVEGKATINTSAITGESAPRNVDIGSTIVSGSINLDGKLLVQTTCDYKNSTVSEILELVENAMDKKASREKFVSKFAQVYTPIVLVLAIVIAVIPSIISGKWGTWIYRALTFLVVSCPCALVISIPLTFFGAIGGASKNGILFKGGNSVEKLSQISAVLFDKTGTLTKGKLRVSNIFPSSKRGEILECATIAESGSSHPLSDAILSEGIKIQDKWDIAEISGCGLIAKKQENEIIVGTERFLLEKGICIEQKSETTCTYVAKNGEYLGFIEFEDEIKSDAQSTVNLLAKKKIVTAILSGDTLISTQKVANKIGIDNIHAELLPQDKMRLARKYSKEYCVAFVGDGINDAPVLIDADIGIAMGVVGSDSAIEAADIVLTTDKLSHIPKAINIAKKAMRIVNENIIFSLMVKIIVLFLTAFGIVGMWLAIIADVGVMILAVLNALRLLSK